MPATVSGGDLPLLVVRIRPGALALPAASDVLRLVPGVSVAVTGARGSQTQLRIRGAETNYTLIFVDGIRFNDPAAGNEARFELLSSDLLSRIEVVRGPQSALCGSEAIGGVVAVETADPLRFSGLSMLGEYGSLDTVRSAAQFATRTGDLGLSGSTAFFRTDRNFDVFPAVRVKLNDCVLASLKLGWSVTEALEAYVRAENLFDAQYEDVFGYNTAGRTIHAGVRVRLGR